MNRTHNPPHPGAILREDVLPELHLTVTEAARKIGVSRVALSRVVNERAAITPRLALKLESWFDRMAYKGGRAETWMQMQVAYDLWKARMAAA
jgi:addiction module HigA family antidote